MKIVRLAVAAAIAAVLVSSAPVAATAASLRERSAATAPSLVAANCDPVWLGHEWQTNINTLQRVDAIPCRQADGKWTITARIHFTRLAGFNSSHVTGCAPHMRLYHDDTAGTPLTAPACTNQVHTLSGPFDTHPVYWTNVGPGYYTVRGWVNIQTATAHYETSGYYSWVVLALN